VVAALQIALGVGLLAVALAFLATVLHRTTERVLVVLAATLVGLAAASGILLAVGAAIDRWDLTELAIVAAGFLAAGAGAVGALALSRGLTEIRSMEDAGVRMREELDASLDAHAKLRITELEHTLARERAETIHQLSEQERLLREDRRTDVAEQLDVARTELTRSVAEAQQRLEQRLSSWSDDLERAQQQLKLRLEELIRKQADALQTHEARLEAHANEVETLGEHQNQAMQRLRAELERAAAESFESAKADIEVHAAERRRALHEVGERLRTRERTMREQIEREQAELRQQLAVALADVERRHLEQLDRALDRSVVRLSEDAERTFDRQLRESREKTAERLSRELELSMEHFMKSAEAEVVNRIAGAAQASAARFQRQIDDLVRAAEVQTEISNERIKALTERLEQSLEGANERLNAFETNLELELATKLSEMERALRSAGQTVERAQSRS